jgi:aspartate aminotransferase
MPGFKALSPPGTFYSFPAYDLRKEGKRIGSAELVIELARNGLICSHGSTFGPRGEHHLRFSFVNSTDQIDKGMDILEETTRPYS